jgi:hypothetical protein
MTTGTQAAEAVSTGRRWVAGNRWAVYAAIFGLYLIARTVIIVGGDVFEAWDSAVYAYRDDPARNIGPLVSFVGDAPRPWGLPLFYALFGNDLWRAVGQWAFGTVAWAFFAWEVSRHLRTRAAQYAVVAALLLFACLNNVASWDLAILTESMSVSIGVLVLGLLLRWFRTGSKAAIAGMTAAAVWWSFIRPDIRLFIGVIMAVLVGYTALRWWHARKNNGKSNDESRGENNSGRITAALVACVVMGLGIVWYSAITPAMTEAMEPYDDDAIQPDPLPQPEQMYVYRLRVDVSTDPEMWQAFKTQLGMPTCPELEAFTSRTDWQGQKWAEAYLRCPPLVAWVAERKDHFGIFWTELAAANPRLAVNRFKSMTSYTVGGIVYAHAPRVVPAPIERLAFPSQRYALPLLLIGFGIALAAAWWAGARRTDRRLFLFSIVLFGTAIFSAAATIVIHTGEIQRYGVQEALAARVAIIVLLATALDAWVLRRQSARPLASPRGQE